ncbi:MAG: transcriptional repressor [Lachnospiraceae bacterium]|nr:transcriptional repressor [Lachnospiraceae bacterium]
MTKNGKYILEIINDSTDHLTAEQIYLRLKEKNSKVVLATVYNNLASLYEQNLIRKVSVEGFPDRYDKMKRHDHLVCKRCGRLSDIELKDFTGRLQEEVGHPILSYDLRIHYICEECLWKEQARNKGGKQE